MGSETSEAALKLTGDGASAINAIRGVTGELRSANKAGGEAGKSIGVSFFKAQLAIEALKVGVRGFISISKSMISFAKESIMSNAEQVAQLRQLNAVLKSTGGVAGITAREVIALSDSLGRLTDFGDEAVLTASNLLLTFTRIPKDLFAETLETTLDLSRALGQDTKQSAIQLGKAMNDPILGATSLRRVGVALTVQQLEQIKVFQESGDLLSAQKLILKELATEFGGSARASVNPWNQLKNVLWDTRQAMAEMIRVPVERWLMKITDAIHALNQSGFFDKGKFVSNMKDALSTGGDIVGIWAKAWGEIILLKMKGAWTNTIDFFKAEMEKFWTWLKTNSPENLITAIPEAVTKLGKAGRLEASGANRAQIVPVFMAPISPPSLAGEGAIPDQVIQDMRRRRGISKGTIPQTTSPISHAATDTTTIQKILDQAKAESAAVQSAFLERMGIGAKAPDEPPPARVRGPGQRPSWARGMTDEQFEAWRSAALKGTGEQARAQARAPFSLAAFRERLYGPDTIYAQHTQGAPMPTG